MSRIANPTTPGTSAPRTAERLETETGDLRIEPAAAARKGTAYLRQLRSTNRRPPELPIPLPGVSLSEGLEQVIAPDIARLAGMDRTEFAYAVAELAWKLEGPVAASGDTGAREGLAVLSQTARMYEHLFLLQTDTDG